MEICPEARFTIADGIKNGEIRFGPPVSSLLCSRSMMSNPPMPEENVYADFFQIGLLRFPLGVLHRGIRGGQRNLNEPAHFL